MNDFSQPFNRKHLDYHQAFNNYLFGDDSDVTDELLPSEAMLYERVTATLESVSDVSSFVPVLPKQMAAFLEEIGRPETDFDRIRGIVESDISLAGETIRVANSPLYRRSQAEIDSLGKAVAMLGLDGIQLIASSLMIKQVLQIESQELKGIGDKLWRHCLECAEVCKILDDSDDPFTSYLMGLVHDVGAVALFSCFAAQYQSSGLHDMNSNRVLMLLLEEQSNWLSAHIARQWKLPGAIIEALKNFDTMQQLQAIGYNREEQSKLALLLEQANAASEVYTLIYRQQLDEGEGQAGLFALGLSEEQVSSSFERLSILSTN